jgi:hypothetical protein
MSPTRRPALPGIMLAFGAVLVIATACADPSPVPAGQAGPWAGASPAVSPSTPSPLTGGRYPMLIIRADEATGPRWFVTLPEDPSRRRPLAVPADALEVGPAGSDGILVMSSSTHLLFVALDGDVSTVIRNQDLGRLGVSPGDPACIGPDQSVAIADRETLALTVVSRRNVAVAIDAPGALGECAWLADGRLLAVGDGDGLIAWDPLTSSGRAVSGGGGRRPSTGGGLLSLVDRSSVPRIVVRSGRLGGHDELELGTSLFEIEAGPDELISSAQFSPDGGWLAVEVTVARESAMARWLRLYRVDGAAAELATQVRLEAREQVSVLPAP